MDDNPSLDILGPEGNGSGAEDPFGSAGLGPSPTLLLPALAATTFDGAILSQIPGFVQMAAPAGSLPNGGFYVSSFSSNHADQGGDISIKFSVDRFSPGAAGDVVVQAGLNQQPGDIFESTKTFADPSDFVGASGSGLFAGALPGVVLPSPGAPSNTLIIDEGLGNGGSISGLGLITPLAGSDSIIDNTTLADPVGSITHDNVDSFDLKIFDAPAGAGDGLFDIPIYLTVYPDEAASTTFGAADIFIGLAGTAAVDVTPYAPAASMGLDSFTNLDVIDALVVFDHGVEEDRDLGDFALFSLGPGSGSLAAFGLSDADVFFTDFSGKFWLYASAADLGLVGVSGGPVRPPNEFTTNLLKDNIDALEINVVPVVTPNPTTSLMWALLGLLLAVPLGRKIKALKL